MARHVVIVHIRQRAAPRFSLNAIAQATVMTNSDAAAKLDERPNLDEHTPTGLHGAPWMAGIAQLVERQVVVLDVTGSSPVARPTDFA
jgi:hypothetical protein